MSRKLLAVALFLACVLTGMRSIQADTIVYLSDGPAIPSNMSVTRPWDPGDPSGSFDIYIRPDDLFYGISLDLESVGNAIKFTGMTVPQYSPRWANARVGTISANGKYISDMIALAIPGFAGDGLDPATANSDAGYNAAIDAFHFATVNYEVVTFGSATLKLRVGPGEYAPDGPLLFGVGDGPAATLGAGSAGKTSTLVDGFINVSIAETSEIAVSGNGQIIANGDLLPSLADGTDFGAATLGSMVERTFEVADLRFGTTLQPPVITGPFSLVGDFPAFVNEGETATFKLALDTSAVGDFTGSISFATDNPGQNPFEFALAARVIPEPTSAVILLGGLLIGWVGGGGRRPQSTAALISRGPC